VGVGVRDRSRPEEGVTVSEITGASSTLVEELATLKASESWGMKVREPQMKARTKQAAKTRHSFKLVNSDERRGNAYAFGRFKNNIEAPV
jgi:hypothetical protein